MECFNVQQHRAIWRAMCELRQAGAFHGTVASIPGQQPGYSVRARAARQILERESGEAPELSEPASVGKKAESSATTTRATTATRKTITATRTATTTTTTTTAGDDWDPWFGIFTSAHLEGNSPVPTASAVVVLGGLYLALPMASVVAVLIGLYRVVVLARSRCDRGMA